MEKMKRKGCFIVRKGEKGETFFNSANVCVEFVFVFFSHWSFCFFFRRSEIEDDEWSE